MFRAPVPEIQELILQLKPTRRNYALESVVSLVETYLSWPDCCLLRNSSSAGQLTVA